jgi:hypothetical protein
LFDFNAFNNLATATVLTSDRLEELLHELGCRAKTNRSYHRYRMPCPIHDGDGHNFELLVGGHTLDVRWSCFSHECHKRFKPSLLGLVHGVLTQQNNGQAVNCMKAVKFLKDFLASTPISSKPKPKPEPKPTPAGLCLSREQVRSVLMIPSPYFVSRGFSWEILDKLDVGTSRKLAAASIVPIYDHDGKLCVGYCQRSEHPLCDHCEGYHGPDDVCLPFDPIPKWQFQAGFPKSEFLYNLDSVRQAGSPYIVLAEGPGDVWRCLETGIPAVACFGTSLSARQAELLAQLGKTVLVAFDNDEAGREGSASAASRLQPLGVAHRVVAVPAEYHDLGEMPTGELCELVAAAAA